MSKYRDLLCTEHNNDIGSVVGCALDRLSREVSSEEIASAIDFYKSNKSKINELNINGRRQAVEEYITNGMQVPAYIKK